MPRLHPSPSLMSGVLATTLCLLGCAGAPPATVAPTRVVSRAVAGGYALAASSRISTALGFSTIASTPVISYATEGQVLGAIESANAAVMQAALAESKAADALVKAQAGQITAASVVAQANAAGDTAAAADAKSRLASEDAAAAKAAAVLAEAAARTAASQAVLTEAKAQLSANQAVAALAQAQLALDAALAVGDGIASAKAAATAADAKAQNAAALAALSDAKAASASSVAAAAAASAAAATLAASSAGQRADAATTAIGAANASAAAAAASAAAAATAAVAAQAATAASPTPIALTVATFVGLTAGFVDGPAALARFDSPSGLDTDASGNVYLADANNHRIRRIAPDGRTVTLAGVDAGLADGTATARFRSPYGVAVAPDGTVYVADTDNHCIRRISPTGTVTTLAGDGTAGLVDGDGAAARFRSPFSVAIAPDGSVYVADSGNHGIRRVTTAGRVTTVTGGTAGLFNGSLAAARFQIPNDLAFDAAGKLYVIDGIANNLRVVDLQAGLVTTLAGGSVAGMNDGRGFQASFNAPSGLAVDAVGNVLVADTMNHAIRKVTPEGVVTTLAGGNPGTTDGAGFAARFSGPSDVAVGPDGRIYVSDTENARLRTIR